LLHRIIRVVRSVVSKVHAGFAVALTFMVFILHIESAVIWVSETLLEQLLMTVILAKHLILVHHMV
jgi:hypothetical protein